MRLRSAVAPAVLATLLVAVAVPAAAQAQPRLSASYPCYGNDESLLLNGSGFTPQGAVALSVSGQQLATVGADPDGSFTARVQSPGSFFGTTRMRFSASARIAKTSVKYNTLRCAHADRYELCRLNSHCARNGSS